MTNNESSVKEVTLAPEAERTQARVRPRAWLALLLAAAAALGALIHSRLTARAAADTALARETREMAAPSVSVIYPKIAGASEELVLPGNVQAYTDAPIFARTSGYLKRWYVDIGARVVAGQILAEIDAPELDHQLNQARADLATAEAIYKLAQSSAERWQHLLKTNSVSRQETDEKIGDLNARRAMAESAAANVRRLENLQSYEKIRAPFDGVITARNTDVGALIDAGANAPGRELFHLASTNKLRVFVSVPEVYRNSARPGAQARLTLDEFPGRVFLGRLVRDANAIDLASRTLLVEIEVDNPRGELLPGSYVSVRLAAHSIGSSALTVPVNTLLFRSEGLRVAVVREGRAQLRPVTIGRDLGNEVEVRTGLKAGEPVIVNPSDSLATGALVRVADSGKKADSE